MHGFKIRKNSQHYHLLGKIRTKSSLQLRQLLLHSDSNFRNKTHLELTTVQLWTSSEETRKNCIIQHRSKLSKDTSCL